MIKLISIQFAASYFLTASLLLSCKSASYREDFRSATVIATKGNSWITNDIPGNEKMISDSGIISWRDTSASISTYFWLEQTGSVKIAVRARVISGKSKIQFNLGDQIKRVTLSNKVFDTIEIGIFNINKAGYQTFGMKGLAKKGDTFAEVTDILLTGSATEGKVYYVKDDFYWGRRGPSVHLRYDIPDEAGDIVWFYNEITVPQGNDVLGSYFMANGFSDGYFGIQVNGNDERRILFSVWSPYKTDNPEDIPEDYRITLLKKGEDVQTGEFGNEGSGGQSFKKYIWKSGTTYGFLLKGVPSVNNSTDYTAYFFAPDSGKWMLIASFRRPKTSTYLKGLHSFLENFLTETGYITRKGFYSGQWIRNKKGIWYELTSVKFTADATARRESRLDYSGGIEDEVFFLKNCGFFNDKTGMNSLFNRKKKGKAPEIVFQDLE